MFIEVVLIVSTRRGFILAQGTRPSFLVVMSGHVLLVSSFPNRRVLAMGTLQFVLTGVFGEVLFIVLPACTGVHTERTV